MQYDHSFSDDNSLKEDEQNDYIMPENSNIQPTNNQDSKAHTNKIFIEESFEKVFNQIFTRNGRNYEIWGDDDFLPPELEKNFEGKNLIKPCPEKKIVIKVEDKKDKYFPFSKGEGLIKALGKIGLSANYNSDSKILISNISLSSMFKTIDYYTDEKGKKKKQKKKRKFKPDDIRKKIKAGFHKSIKNIINNKLQKAGSKNLFTFFPQSFITNITIKLNNKAFDLTFEELIQNDNGTKGKIDLDKYNKNLEVLNYLKNNPEISKNSEFEIIKKMKYVDILKAYFLSMEFENSIKTLFDRKEKLDYIEEYINKALTYVPFFSSNKKLSNYSKNFKESEKNNINQIANKDENEEEEEEEVI